MNKWEVENRIIKEWVETCPTKFTCNDIFFDLEKELVCPETLGNYDINKRIADVKKAINQQVQRLILGGYVGVYRKRSGRRPGVYYYIQDPIKTDNKPLEPAAQTPTTTTVQEPKQQEPVVSEHEMGRAIYDYIMHLREQVKNLNNDVKAYKHELKLAREDIGNQLKNKDKVIANLNDKIIELNRLVNNKPGSARTFSLGEMARVTSFRK